MSPAHARAAFDAAIFAQAKRLAFFCIVGLTVAVFAQGLFGSFLWGDATLISKSYSLLETQGGAELLRTPLTDASAPSGAVSASYRPLSTLSYGLDYTLFGERPFGYHLVSLLVHLLCVALVFRFLYARLERDWHGAQAWQALAGATAGSLLFALHPSRPEVVSWISGRADALMTAAVLGGFLLFGRLRGGARGLVAGFAFVVGLLCNELAVIAPLMLLCDVALGGADEDKPARLRQAWLATAITLLGMLARCWVLPPHGFALRTLLAELPLRVLASFGIAARNLVWPTRPSLLTALQPQDARGMGGAVWSLALGAALVLLLSSLLWAVRRAEKRESSALHAYKPWLADALLCAVPLLAVPSVMPLARQALVADRVLYLPLLGLSALTARALARGLDHAPWRSTLTTFAALAMLGLCAAGTLRYMPAFGSDLARNDYEYALHPGSTHVLEARVLLQQDRGDDASALRTALEGYQAATRQREPAAQLHFVLLTASLRSASLRDSQERELRALDTFYEALERGEPALLELTPLRLSARLALDDQKRLIRDVAGYVVPRALLLARLGDIEAGVALLERCVQGSPRDAQAWRTLALLEALAGRYSRALDALSRAEQTATPPDTESAGLRQRVLAARAMTEAQDLSPTSSALTRAEASLLLGSAATAARVLDPALAQQPSEPALIAMRARVDAVQGELSSARARIAEALALLPQERARFDAVLAEIDEAAQLQRTRKFALH